MKKDAERLREDELRPDRLRAEQVRRFAADNQRLLARLGEFVEVACPACDSRQRRARFEKNGFRYAECSDCATLYISPRPTPAILDAHYAESENYAYWSKVLFPASAEVRREKIFKPRVARTLELCTRYGAGTEVLLEVGAGFGIFCEEMRKSARFRRIIAVEPSPGLAEACRASGVEVIERPIEQVNLGATRVDAIASFEVIEHLFCPREFVERCAGLLSPGGLLVLTCPNGKGFDVQTLGAACDGVDIHHLNYFNPASLAALVARCGFEVLEVSTPGRLDAELVRKKVLAGQFSLDAQPFLREVLLERWEELGAAFQDFLAEHALSSHMWLAARRA